MSVPCDVTRPRVTDARTFRLDAAVRDRRRQGHRSNRVRPTGTRIRHHLEHTFGSRCRESTTGRSVPAATTGHDRGAGKFLFGETCCGRVEDWRRLPTRLPRSSPRNGAGEARGDSSLRRPIRSRKVGGPASAGPPRDRSSVRPGPRFPLRQRYRCCRSACRRGGAAGPRRPESAGCRAALCSIWFSENAAWSCRLRDRSAWPLQGASTNTASKRPPQISASFAGSRQLTAVAVAAGTRQVQLQCSQP